MCEGLYSGVETTGCDEWREVRWFGVERDLRQGCSLSPLLLNIYMMGIVEELEIAQLGVKLEECCGALCMWTILYWWRIQGGGTAADYVRGGSSVCNEVEDEVHQMKSKIMVVGKREGKQVGEL